MDNIYSFSEPTSPIAEALGKLLPLDQTQNEDAIAFLVDFATQSPADDSWLAFARQARKPIILLNTPEDTAIPGCVASFPSRASILILEEKYVVLQVLDATSGTLSRTEETISVNLEKRTFTEPESRELPCESQTLSDDDLARVIESAVEPSAIDALRQNAADIRRERCAAGVTSHDVSILPYPQYKIQYTYFVYNIPLTDSGQTWQEALVMEVALFASYGATSKKYLRLTALRTLQAKVTLFQMGYLRWDDSYNRGYFTDFVNYTLTSASADVKCAEVLPSGGGSGDYSSNYSVVVGVDTSKFPQYYNQYDIGGNLSFSASDFWHEGSKTDQIATINNHMELNKNDQWNMFEEPFMRKARVKGIPALAVSNYSPLFECRFESAGSFAQATSFSCDTKAHCTYAWVSGNWASYVMHLSSWDSTYSFTGCSVNFADVSC
jgi:hypothetical protein